MGESRKGDVMVPEWPRGRCELWSNGRFRNKILDKLHVSYQPNDVDLVEG